MSAPFQCPCSSVQKEGKGMKSVAYLCLLDGSLLQNLLYTFILIARPELAIQYLLACSVEEALGAVSLFCVSHTATLQPQKQSTDGWVQGAYLWVTKILKPLTTWASGIEWSSFHFWTDFTSSTRMTKSSSLP